MFDQRKKKSNIFLTQKKKKEKEKEKKFDVRKKT